MANPKVTVLPITEGATLDPNNINKHTQRGGALLENSLRKRGAFRSIASAGKGVKTPVVMAGNYTLEKAIDAGFTEIVNVHVTGNQIVNVVRNDLDPTSAEAIALGLEDNEIGKQSYAPDIDMLATLAAGDHAVLATLRATDSQLHIMLDGMLPYKVNFDDEWQGMPEFTQNAKDGFIITVHFLTLEDKANFFAFLQYNGTEKTRAIWYPVKPEFATDTHGTKRGLVYSES